MTVTLWENLEVALAEKDKTSLADGCDGIARNWELQVGKKVVDM